MERGCTVVVASKNAVVVGTMLDIFLCCDGHASRTQGQRHQGVITEIVYLLGCEAWKAGLLEQRLVSPPLNNLQEITSMMGIDTGRKN